MREAGRVREQMRAKKQAMRLYPQLSGSGDRARSADLDASAADAYLDAAWPSHGVALLDRQPVIGISNAALHQIRSEWARGAAGRRIFHDRDTGKEPACVRDCVRRACVERECLAAFAGKRSRERQQRVRVRSHTHHIVERSSGTSRCFVAPAVDTHAGRFTLTECSDT